VGPADQQARLALLWASLYAAAETCATAAADRSAAGDALSGDHRRPVVLPDAGTAVQDAVAQCHAMIFGFQAAIAELSGARSTEAFGELARYRDLRDALSAQLNDHGQRVPAAHAAYQLPIQPTSAAAAAHLISVMETRMLPYLGLWAATGRADRKTALQALTDTSRQAFSWSGRIPVWPGWPVSSS
jgi:hypothetical protein